MTTAYLTIDDAPSADLPEKLAILEERDVPTLFFCEGRRLEDYPDHARRAVEAGFHLGNHAYSHPHASDIAVEAFVDELERTESLLADVYDDAGVSRPAKLFRFPFGDMGGARAARFQQVLEREGFTAPDPDRIDERYAAEHGADRDWHWTVSVGDWRIDSRAELRERVAAAVTDRLASPGSDIVLFHDAGNTPALFAAFVDLLLERGVEFEAPLSLVQ